MANRANVFGGWQKDSFRRVVCSRSPNVLFSHHTSHFYLRRRCDVSDNETHSIKLGNWLPALLQDLMKFGWLGNGVGEANSRWLHFRARYKFPCFLGFNAMSILDIAESTQFNMRRRCGRGRRTLFISRAECVLSKSKVLLESSELWCCASGSLAKLLSAIVLAARKAVFSIWQFSRWKFALE